MNEQVNENDLVWSLERLRDLELTALINGINRWAFRQALIIALEIDRKTIISSGIPEEIINKFDELAREDIRETLQGIVGT